MFKQLILFLVGFIARILKFQEKEESKEQTKERQKTRKQKQKSETNIWFWLYFVVILCVVQWYCRLPALLRVGEKWVEYEYGFFFILVHAVVLCYIGYKRRITLKKRLRWSRGSVLAFGTQVRGFKPGRCRWIFQGQKIIITPSFGREVKPFVPCRIFAACKRTRKCMRGSRSFRSKLPAISRPSSFSFHY